MRLPRRSSSPTDDSRHLRGRGSGQRQASGGDPRLRDRRRGDPVGNCHRALGGPHAGAAVAQAARRRPQGGPRGPRAGTRAGAAGWRRGTRAAASREHHRGGRAGRARRRRTARTGRLPGRRAGPAAAAGRRHVRDVVAAQPVPRRPAARAHRPARARRGRPRTAGEPVQARPPRRTHAPQRRQPAGAGRLQGAARAGRPGAGRRPHQCRRLRGRGLRQGRHRRPFPTARSAASSLATSSICWPNCWTTRCGTPRRPPRCGCRQCTPATADWSSRSPTAASAWPRPICASPTPACNPAARSTPTPRVTWVCSWSAGSPRNTAWWSDCATPLPAEPDSGTTAGVFIPAELLLYGPAVPSRRTPTTAPRPT